MSEAKIKLRVDGAGSAKSDIQSVADTFDSLGDSAKGALGGLAAGLSAGALATWVKGAIDAADNLNDLSKSTSIAVEQLAGLDLAARQSGGNLDSIAQSINKLSVNIGKDADKFAKIGITAKEPLEAFKQLADVYNSIQDPQQKAAFGAEALGKAWQGAAPLLAEGGDAIGEMVEKGTKLSGMTQDFADSSDAFNDSLAEMQTALGGAAARLGADLLPLLNEVTTSLSDTSQEAADAAVAFNPITETFRALIVIGGNIAYVFKGVGTELGGVAAQISALSTGEWKQAIAIGEAMKEDAAKARETFDQWEARIMNVGKVAKQTAKEVAELPATQPGQKSNGKPSSDAISGFIGAGDGLGKAEAERAIKARTSFIAALEKERQTLGKTTEQNKLYEASLLGIKGRQLDLVKAKLVDIEAQKSLIKETERWDGIAKSMADEQKKYMDAMYNNIDSLKSQVDAQQEYNDNLGLSKEALAELAATKLEDTAAGKERNAQMLEEIGIDTRQIAILREEAEELRKLANLKREGSKKEQTIERDGQLAEQAKRDFEKLQDESQKFTDSLYEGLSDSLFRGFEDGKGFGVSMRDSIVNLFKTNAIKITAQVITTGILGFGAVGPASAGQSGNILGDPTSLISAGKSLYEGFTAAGTLGNGFLGSLAGGLQGAGAGSGLTSSLGLSIGNSIQSTLGTSISSTLSSGLSSIATAMPYAAAAAAALAISKNVNGDYRLGGLSANQGALLGFAPRLFGMKEKELGGQTVTGTLGTDNLMRNQSWTQDGGLFRSSRSGVWSYGLKDSTAIQDGKAYTDAASLQSDKALLTMLNDTYASVKAVSADYAKALGLNADSIASRADALSLTLGKTQEETQAAIQKTFGTIADSIAADLLPAVQELAKENETASVTLARVALSFGTVNQAFGDLGLKLYDIGTAGYSAAANFTELVGGIDAFKNVTSSYYQNFYTQEERNANVIKSLTAELEKQNLVLPSSRDGYRALVEEVSKTGSPEQLASLFKLSDAFASVFDGVDSLSTGLPIFMNSAMSVATALDGQYLAQRRIESAAIAATQALEAQAKATQEAARIEAQKAYDDNLQGRLRSGRVGDIMSDNYGLNPIDMSTYVSAGQFNAAGFNSQIIRQRAKLAIDLANQASADAINVEDITSVLSSLFDFTKDREFENELRRSLPANARNQVSETVGYVFSDFIDASIAGIRLDQYTSRGKGITSIIAAQEDLQFQTDLQSAYRRSLSSANEMLRLGIVTQDQYATALADANAILKDNVKSQDLLNEAIKQAGIDSIGFYFDQIGLSVERLNAAAEKAAEPLALVTSAIGRFTSVSDVFSLSANAAGGDANAELVAQSAKIAAQVLTTQSAAQAAKELAEKAAFSGASSTQLRDYSLLIEGVKQFDPNSFEAGFLRISDALNKGTIDQAQYQDLFSVSLDMFKGVESESSLLAKTMGTLRESMTSFADSLLIDKSKTTLSDAARMQEVMRQYDQAKIGAMAGDANAISQFQSLGAQLASRENYSSRAEANYGFSRVLADSQLLSRYAERDASAPQVAAIKELEKTISDRFDKQFSIMRSQLLELQGARTEAARKNLPTTGVTA
ncbi:hypothetical protein [Undibacterium macrobrachii]|uniref:Bacteriophage tail tape measure N-terminal domain-containing protein n=1 Tax=Undibacterium macrobrachii TaxID=1119058 RepID=A0ABQ2X687_9BURK|nr:hypothetical protein [Undibacterium macrobrachii]GGX01412.1 hypothetical protein GCM10011282_04170 [Undibacterium macrobrachii]